MYILNFYESRNKDEQHGVIPCRAELAAEQSDPRKLFYPSPIRHWW